MAATWEVGNNGSTYIYKEDGATEASVTITGLAENLLTGDTPSENAPRGVLISEKVITISNDALPTDSLTAGTTKITVSGTGYTLALASDGITTPSGTLSGTPTITYVDETDTTVARITGTVATAGWQENSSTEIAYTNAAVLATVSGLKKNTRTGIELRTDNNIEVGSTALGTSQVTLTNKITGTVTYALTLADGILSSKEAAADGYELTVSGGTATVTPKYQAYWTLSDTKITYNPVANGNTAATVSNLSNSASADNVSFNETTKVFTLKKGALDESGQNSVMVDTTGYTLALYDDSTDTTNHVTRAGTKENTDFSWGITAVEADANADTPASTTAKLQKTLTAGWELDTNAKNATYKQAQTLTYTTITGLAENIEEDALPELAKDAALTSAITLNQDVLPTTDGAVVKLANENTTDDDSVASNFTLALADGIPTPGTKTAGNTIAIDVTDIGNGNAKVVQTFQEGWTLSDSTVTYKAAVPVTLATITNLSTSSTASNITIGGKTVTLDKNAVTESAVNTTEGGDKRIKITPTDITTSEFTTAYGAYNYTEADLAYGLALDSGVQQTQESTGNTLVSVTNDTPEDPATEATTATAIVVKEKKAYYSADKAEGAADTAPATVITYHPQGAGTANSDFLATIKGLKAGATAALSTDTSVQNPSIVVDASNSAKTITLTAAALVNNEGTKVTIDTSKDTSTGKKYTLKLDDDVQAPGEIPAAGEEGHAPALNTEKLPDNHKVTVEQALTAGWSIPTTGTDAGKVVYEAPDPKVLATITFTNDKTIAADALADAIKIDETDAKQINITGAILENDGNDSTKWTTVTIANADDNTYKLALADGVTVYGSDDNDKKITIKITGETDEPKSATVQLTESAGWKCDATNGISYGAAHDVVFATITNLSKDADATDSTGNIALGTDENSNPTVVLKKTALTTDAEKPTTLVNNANLKDEANYETYKANVYKFALDDAADGTISADDKDPGSQIVKEDNKQVVSMTVTNGTAEIKATLNEGWKLATEGDDAGKKIIYTAPAVDAVLATVTGLNTTTATYTEDGNSNTVDFAITAAAAEPDAGVITLKTDALTDGNVTLTNQKDTVAKFTLKLQAKQANDTYENVTEYGHEPTYAWTDESKGTGTRRTVAAAYRTSNKKGWTLAADGSGITYDAEILAKNSNTILATVTGLKDGFTINNDYTYKDPLDETKTIAAPAIGMGEGAAFVAGLYVTTEYDADTPSTAGTMYIAKNLLNADAAKPVTLEDGEGEYTFSLDDTDTKANEALYIPTAATDRNIWAVETKAKSGTTPKSTTATYKTVETEFWTLADSGDDNGKKITYTAQANKKDGTNDIILATITGLAEGITVKDFAIDDPIDATKPQIKISKLVAADGTTVVANFGAFTGDSGSEVFNTEDEILGDLSNNATIDTIQLDKGALTTMNAALDETGKATYKLAINETGADAVKVTAPVFDDNKAKWTVTSVAATQSAPATKTATYKGYVTTAGYTLSADKYIVKYTKAGETSNPLATITGLDSTVVVNNTNAGNQVGTKDGSTFTQGITVGKATIDDGQDAVEYDAFKLADNVLGTTTVTVANTDTDISNYKLDLDEDVMDSTDPEVTQGVKAWRFDKHTPTTATYGELTPAYYTLDITENSDTYLTQITYTAESEQTIDAKITGLKAGLTLTDDTYTEEISGKEVTFNTSGIDGITVTTDEDNNDIIKLTEAVLATDDGKSAELTEGSYKLVLDNVDAVEINKTATMSWTVEAGETATTKKATLKGSTTAGWTLNDDANKVTYTAAKTAQTFVTIKGLNSSVTNTKLKNAYSTLPADGTFALQEAFLTNSNVTIENGELPNGKDIIYKIDEDDNGNPVEVKYGIAIDSDLAEASAKAITGDPRWYFDATDETKTTLVLANIHDAHYVNGKLTDGTDGVDVLDPDNITEDSSIITYIAEVKGDDDNTPYIARLTNLASGLKLNGNGDYYSGLEPVNGIKVDDLVIAMKKNVLTTDEEKDTTLTNSTDANYSLTLDAEDVPKFDDTPLKRFKVETVTSGNTKSTTATLSEGTLEGWEQSDDTTIEYHKEAFTDVAVITGLKSGLIVDPTTDTETADKHPSIGTMQKVGTATTKTFVAGLTYDDDNKITLTNDVLDATAGKTVSINADSTYTLKLNEDVPTPEEGTGWEYTPGTGDKLTTAEYKEGTQAGWKEGTNSFTYQDAAYKGDTVATLNGLANDLKLSTDCQTITNSSGKAAVYEGTDESTGEGTNKIILTSYAFAKDDVTLKNAENQEYTLDLFQGYTKNADGTTSTTPADGYVKNSVTTKEWAKAANSNKATYTINVPEGYNIATEEELAADREADATYNAKVSYIAPKKQVATLTGINSSLTVSADKAKLVSGSTDAITVDNQKTTDGEGTEQIVEDKYVLTLAANAVNKAKVSLAKGDFILSFDDTKPKDEEPVWNKEKKSTKATLTQSYPEDSYALSADKMSIAYTKNRVDTFLTIEGLSKDLESKDGAIEGVSVATKPKTSTSSNVNANVLAETDGEGEDDTNKIKLVQLSDKSVINSGSSVKLTNGKVNGVTQEYRLWLGTEDTETEAAKAFATGSYANSEDYNNQPLWTVDNKGKATLDEGTYEGWSYKVNKDKSLDYTNLVYVKPTKVITATLTGLATNLTVGEDGDIYTADGNGHATDELAVSFTPKEGTTPGTISLTSKALPTSVKNNAKIALALGKVNGTTVDYKLSGKDVSEGDIATDDDYSTWSINKGTASYQYGTSKGWTFSDTGAVYTDEKKTVVAKISGINKTLNTFTGTDDKGKPADVPWSTDVVEEHIKVDVTGTEQGKQTFTFTLLDADYLAGSKVTLKKANSKDTNKYIIQADESLKPYDFADGDETHPAQWTVNGKNGSAKLTAGTSAGYTDATDKNAGTVVNYSKEKTAITYFTISGLLKDKDKATGTPDLETQIVENAAITYNVTTQKVSLSDAAVLGTSNVSLTSGKKADKTAYTFTFDEDSLATADGSESKIDTDKTIWLQAKGGTVNLVETAKKDFFALSTDGKKLNYNKKAVDTVLATIKGLNKTLAEHNDAIVTSTTTKVNGEPKTTYGTEPVVTIEDGGVYGEATIKLAAGALNDSNITFTTNQKLKDREHKYNLVLDTEDESILTSKVTPTEWTFSKGTASYRTYDKGYYKASEKNKGGFDFVKETRGTTYATISGLNPDVDDDTLAEALAAFNDATSKDTTSGKYVGTITLDSSMLVTKDKKDAASGKAVTLKNSATKNETETDLKLELDTTNLVDTMVSTFKVADAFTGNRLMGTYSTGYALASDTSITYLAKEKGNQLVATVNGISTVPNPSSDGTITLDAASLPKKSVTLTVTDLADKDYKLSFTATPPEITAAENTDNRTNGWEVKNGKATFTGFVTEGYRFNENNPMSITYTKAVGTPESETNAAKPDVAMTISNVGSVSGDSEGVTVSGGTDGKATTLSNGLIAVEFSGTNIAGSNEADTITLTSGASVKGGKGDDNITLSNGADTILYGNGDGNDVVEDFSSSDKIILTGGKVTTVVEKDGNAVVKVGTGSITLNGYTGVVNIYDTKNPSNNLWGKAPVESSSDVLLADNNYSADAAALSDIVEPFKASYTPYDFDAGLDLVKKDNLAPAVTFTGDDKK